MQSLILDMAPCAAAFSLSPGMMEVVIFGGCTCLSAIEDDVIADTNVLRFGKC